jgi:hypothetical protein
VVVLANLGQQPDDDIDDVDGSGLGGHDGQNLPAKESAPEGTGALGEERVAPEGTMYSLCEVKASDHQVGMSRIHTRNDRPILGP